MKKFFETKFEGLKKGFTLVELLVVIGVIGVLAAGLVAVINPVDRVNRANDAKVQSDFNQVAGAYQSYAAQNSGLYPATTAWTAADLGADLANELSVIPSAPTGYTYNVTSTSAVGGTALIYALLQSNNYRNKVLAEDGSTAITCESGATSQAYWYWTNTNGRFCGYCAGAAPTAATTTCHFTK